MNINRTASRAVLAFVASLLLLGACAPGKPETSSEVIKKFKSTAVAIKSIDFSADAKIKSEDKGDSMDVTVGVVAKIDRREGVDRKADFSLKLDGGLEAGEKSLSGSLDVLFRTLGEKYFFKISKLESDNGSLDKYKQIIDGNKGKWLSLASDFVPSSLKQLQQKDEKTLEREKKLKDLFVGTNLFEVNKEFGIESLNGKKVYHYGIRLNEDGLRDYIRKGAQIDGREMSDAEVEQSASFAKSVSNLEFWIGVKDYYLYKGVLSLVGSTDDGKTKSEVSLSYVGNNYDVNLRIEAPEKSEAFDPITLLMQLQVLNPPNMDSEPSVSGDEGVPTGEAVSEGASAEKPAEVK